MTGNSIIPSESEHAMNSITITLPLPSKLLSPNARCHWAAKAKVVKHYRQTACYLAREAAGYKQPMWQQATLKVRAFFKTARHPDPDNILASLKAAIDGIADAGIIANDRTLWPERPEIGKDKDRPRIEMTITPST